MEEINLDGANLIRAKLQSVRFQVENELIRANCMFGATVPDGSDGGCQHINLSQIYPWLT